MADIGRYITIERDSEGYPVTPPSIPDNCLASWRTCLSAIHSSKLGSDAARYYQYADGYLSALVDADVIDSSAAHQLHAQLIHEWTVVASRL